MFEGDPGPCPVCGTAHAACKGDTDSEGIGVTRGVVIRQLPQRDAGVNPVAAAEPAAPATTPRAARRAARAIRR